MRGEDFSPLSFAMQFAFECRSGAAGEQGGILPRLRRGRSDATGQRGCALGAR